MHGKHSGRKLGCRSTKEQMKINEERKESKKKESQEGRIKEKKKGRQEGGKKQRKKERERRIKTEEINTKLISVEYRN